MIYMTKAGMFCCKKDKNTRIVVKEKMRNFDNTIIYVRTGKKKIKMSNSRYYRIMQKSQKFKIYSTYIYTQGLKNALKIKTYPLFFIYKLKN